MQQLQLGKNTSESASTTPFNEMKTSSFLQSPWCDQSCSEQERNQIKLCKIGHQPSVSTQPLLVTHTITINDDCTWTVTVHGREITKSTCDVLSVIPHHLTSSKLHDLIIVLDTCEICPGNADKCFIKMAKSRKGKFFTRSGELRAELQPELESGRVSETIRTTNCDFLVKVGKCSKCSMYRSQLRMMSCRYKRKPVLSHKFCNERYLNTPQRL